MWEAAESNPTVIAANGEPAVSVREVFQAQERALNALEELNRVRQAYETSERARNQALQVATVLFNLLPALVAAASTPGAGRVIPHLDADVAIAEALWRITGRAEETLRLLAGVLGETGLSWIRWTFVRAARVAALLGDEGRPLVPELEKLLTHPLHTPAAVLALHAIAPGTLDVGAAAGLLLDSAEDDADAATALEALLALGPDALAEDHARRLTVLAERDLRVTASGVETTIASTDDRLREQAGQVLRALGAGPTAAGA
ncbi:hypothetical protein ACH4LT_03700 [Streptomyces clavifer]|uniref:hypothetical protein n=1 Tax=Streptomyces clavifer TaxID=68188 RepID=UPI0037A66E8D